MKHNVSRQLGLPVAPPQAKAPSLEAQLGFTAEYDKSLNTNNNGGFFNATGEEKNFKEYYKGSIDAVKSLLRELKIDVSEDLDYLESEKKRFQAGKSELEGKINAIKLNQLQSKFGTDKAQERGKSVSQLWSVDKAIELIDKRIADVKVILEKRAAKAKADAEAAEAKLKAEAEAARQAKIAALKKQIEEAKDPSIKKQLTDELSGLLQEGKQAIGGNKVLLIGGAVAVLGLLYYFFRSKE